MTSYEEATLACGQDWTEIRLHRAWLVAEMHRLHQAAEEAAVRGARTRNYKPVLQASAAFESAFLTLHLADLRYIDTLYLLLNKETL